MNKLNNDDFEGERNMELADWEDDGSRPEFVQDSYEEYADE